MSDTNIFHGPRLDKNDDDGDNDARHLLQETTHIVTKNHHK